MSYRHAEYDDYLEGYREAQNRQIALSGETAEYFAEYKIKKLAHWLSDLASRPAAVLDYGCGDGLMTSRVPRHFPRAAVYGIDPSSKSVERARQRYPGITFACVQESALPFADDSLDLVFASGVFHHIPFAEHRALLVEMFRVLKPGGAFALFELNPFNPFSAYVFLTSPFDRHARFMFPRYSRQLLGEYGPVRVQYCSFFPRILAALRPFEPRLERIPLGAHYACIVKKGEMGKEK